MPQYSRLATELAQSLRIKSVILDGEIVAFDAVGRHWLGALVQSLYEPSYVAFDVLWLNGKDLRELPLRERRKHLTRVLPKSHARIQQCVSHDQWGTEFFEKVVLLNLEGIVAKQLTDPYRRWVKWYKIPNPHYSHKIERRRSSKKKGT